MASPTSGLGRIPRWRRFRWRVVVLVMTVLLGMAGFLSGVSVTQRPEIVDADFPTMLYYTLGLFIFGGMDLGTPIGGPTWARVSLWTAYFSAPAITASAVVETMLRLIGDDRWRWRRRRGHIVVAGCGRLTSLYLERLRAHDPHVEVVVVGTEEDAAGFDTLRNDFSVFAVEGDIGSDAWLRRLRVDRASRVLLLADDDFINLDAAERILAMAPDVAERTVVHVSDLRFLRSMVGTRLGRTCRVFNGHQIAASHLVHAHVLAHFDRTEPCDTVVLAGFGRFGQTVLDELQHEAVGEFDHVVIVDLEATRACAVFAEQVGFADGLLRDVVDGDIRDPDVWHRVEDYIDQAGRDPVVIVGSGEDRTNMRIALRMASRLDQALVIARSERKWAFAEAFSREKGIQTLSVAQLVAESMPQTWFVADPELGLEAHGSASARKEEPRTREALPPTDPPPTPQSLHSPST